MVKQTYKKRRGGRKINKINTSYKKKKRFNLKNNTLKSYKRKLVGGSNDKTNTPHGKYKWSIVNNDNQTNLYAINPDSGDILKTEIEPLEQFLTDFFNEQLNKLKLNELTQMAQVDSQEESKENDDGVKDNKIANIIDNLYNDIIITIVHEDEQYIFFIKKNIFNDMLKVITNLSNNLDDIISESLEKMIEESHMNIIKIDDYVENYDFEKSITEIEPNLELFKKFISIVRDDYTNVKNIDDEPSDEEGGEETPIEDDAIDKTTDDNTIDKTTDDNATDKTTENKDNKTKATQGKKLKHEYPIYITHNIFPDQNSTNRYVIKSEMKGVPRDVFGSVLDKTPKMIQNIINAEDKDNNTEEGKDDNTAEDK
jgi:hypothetical protein